jgi:hypothetical protein
MEATVLQWHKAAGCQSVALEAGTCKQYHEEGTQRIKDSSSRTFAVRHTNIEEEIVKRCIHQCKGKNKLPVVALAHLKRTSTATGHRKDYQPCRRKPDASKKHLAARHVCGDAKGYESHFDEWECPTPSYCRCQGKNHHPHGSLEYGYFRLFHLILSFFQCFSTLSYTKLSHLVGANVIVLKLVLYLCTGLHAAGYAGEDSNCYYRNGHYLLQRYKNYSYQLAKWDKYFHLVSSFYQYSLRNSAISLGFD